MRKFDAFECLFVSFLVTMELRKNSTKLKAQSWLHLYLKYPIGDALALYSEVVWTQMVNRSLQTEGTLLKLALFLVAHRHIMEQLEGHKFILGTTLQINYV